MRTQPFDTAGQLKLEVARRTRGAGDVVANLVKNPRGQLGAWGWTTPAETTFLDPVVQGDPSLNAAGLKLYGGGPQANTWRACTELEAVTPGAFYQGGLTVAVAPPGGTGVDMRLEWFDSSRTLVGSGATASFGSSVAVNSVKTTAVAAAPPSAAFVRLRIDLVFLFAGAAKTFTFDKAFIAQVPTSGSAGAYAEPWEWVDVLSNSTSVTVDRPGRLQPGTMRASVLDATLDPSTSTFIRPGAQVRVMAADPDNGAGAWAPIFTGELVNAVVDYDLTHQDEDKRVRIDLSAVDNTQTLANTQQSIGVASVRELAYLLEGAGVPWRLDGLTNQIAGAAVKRTDDDSASLLTQIANVQNTLLTYAFVDRWGAVNVTNRTVISATTFGQFGEGDYQKNIKVDFDTARLVNEVSLKDRTLDADGRTVETPMGPYRDEPSIREWGRYTAEYARHGGSAMSVASFVAAVLDANKTPQRAVRELSFRVMDALADFRSLTQSPAGSGKFTRRVHLELADKVRVVNTRAAIDQDMRVGSIRHAITPKSWTVTVGFDSVAGVPLPAGGASAPVPQASAVNTGWKGTSPGVNVPNMPQTQTYSKLIREGNWVTWEAGWRVNGAPGAGVPFWLALPYPHFTGVVQDLPMVIGTVSARRNGVAYIVGHVVLRSQTTASFSQSDGAIWHGSYPYSWNSPDDFRITIRYMAADA